MTTNYSRHYGTKKTPQSEAIPGETMVENSAGGYSYEVDKWTALNRFLILGTEGGSYYASEKKLTKASAKRVVECIKEDGPRVVKTLTEISDMARAPKNDPALFVLAMCIGLGDAKTKKEALSALPKVARIGTHLFHFAEFVQNFRGWGRSLRRAVAGWYLEKDNLYLAHQLIKYQSRDGWSNRDLIQLSHPKTKDEEKNALFKWVMDGKPPTVQGKGTGLVMAVEGARTWTDPAPGRKGEFIKTNRLPREALPTEWLKDPEVWEALLPGMGITALIRNLGNLSKIKLLHHKNQGIIKEVCSRITDKEILKKGRVHPIQILSALLTYGEGHGIRGSGEWDTMPDVMDALDEAFYLAFDNVEPTKKRYLLGIDVSGSMGGGQVAGVPGLTPCIGAAAMTMVFYRTEQTVVPMAFCNTFTPFKITRKMLLRDVAREAQDWNFGGTDCALPMIYALQNKIPIDVFVVLTDSETWAGNIHPSQALRQYRREMVPDAKLVVVGMVANDFTIADPKDRGMLDVVGFDTAVPEVMRQFALGEI